MMTFRTLCFVLLTMLVGAPSATAAPSDIARVDMHVAVQPDRQRVHVEGTMRIPPSPDRRDGFVLSLNKVFAHPQFEVIAPTRSANTVMVAEHGGFTDYTFTPAHPFGVDETVTVRFSYESDPAIPVSYFYVGHDGAFASGVNVAWYPQLATPTAQARVEGHVRFDVPQGWSVTASGGRTLNPQPSVFTLGTARPTQIAFAAGPYVAVDRPGGVPIHLRLLTARTHAAHYAEMVQRVIAALAYEFGAYPFGEFSVVEVPEAAATKSGFSGQGEAGMIWVTPRFLTAVFNVAYYGHEVGHQWWGQLVEKDFTGDSGFYMPDEAVAQYGSLQAVRAIEGEAAAERYRRTGYPGYVALQNGLGYLSLVAAGYDDTIDAPRKPWSHLLANGKGMLALESYANESAVSACAGSFKRSCARTPGEARRGKN